MFNEADGLWDSRKVEPFSCYSCDGLWVVVHVVSFRRVGMLAPCGQVRQLF